MSGGTRFIAKEAAPGDWIAQLVNSAKVVRRPIFEIKSNNQSLKGRQGVDPNAFVQRLIEETGISHLWEPVVTKVPEGGRALITCSVPSMNPERKAENQARQILWEIWKRFSPSLDEIVSHSDKERATHVVATFFANFLLDNIDLVRQLEAAFKEPQSIPLDPHSLRVGTKSARQSLAKQLCKQDRVVSEQLKMDTAEARIIAMNVRVRRTDFQKAQRPRGRELMVVAIKPARVVDRRILCSEDPTATQNCQGQGNSTGYASLPALRGLDPLRETPSPSEALASTGGTGGFGARV